MRMFPELRGPSGYLDLNELARPHVTGERSPFLDHKKCQELVNGFHKERNLAFSYGGYMEDRSAVWRGSYMAVDNKYRHLGVDFNVPAGTFVAAPRRMKLLLTDSDYPEESGWGTRVIAQGEDGMILIFAHLDPKLLCTKVSALPAGEVFAMVGRAPFNGGWYEHVHVQAVVPEAWEAYKHNLRLLDGYGRLGDEKKLRKLHPDPIPSLGRWQ